MPAAKAIYGSFEWNEYLNLENSFTLKFGFSTPNGTLYEGIRVDHLTFSMYYIIGSTEELVYQSRFLNENARAFQTYTRVVIPIEQSYLYTQLTLLSGLSVDAYPISLDTKFNSIYLEGSKYVYADSLGVSVEINGWSSIVNNFVTVTVENASHTLNRTTGSMVIRDATNDVVVSVKGILNQDNIYVVLYNNTSEKNRLDKTNYLTEISTLSGVFRDEVDLTDVDIDIEYDIVDTDYGALYNINYVYIPIFRRFYFVDNISFTRKNLITLKCSIDVLYTYRAKILELYGFVDRNEFDYNDKIIDTKRVAEQGTDVISFASTYSAFDTIPGTITPTSTNIVINALASSTTLE